jgi:hypothetical protein
MFEKPPAAADCHEGKTPGPFEVKICVEVPVPKF